jgi:hypothetical protein
MKITYSFYLVFFILMIGASCNKSKSTPANPLQNNWSFISVQGAAQNVFETSGGTPVLKKIDYTQYSPTNIGGAIGISSSTFTLLDFSYNVSGKTSTYNYLDNQISDSTSNSFSYSSAPINGTIPYVMVGADSVYFPNGGFISAATYPSGFANGAKITIANDTLLTITTSFSKDSSGFLYGMASMFHFQETVTARFSRQ